MTKALSNVTLQLKNGTKANWTSINPVLAKGELGLESDTAHFKFGDGVNAWNSLPYAGTLVKVSSTNGNINIDGTDVTVYALPIATSTILGGVKSQSAGSGKVVVAADGTMGVSEVPTADALTTARTISITGDATGSNTFSGATDCPIAIVLANSGVTAGTYTKLTVDGKGRVTAGAALSVNDISALTLSKITDAGTAAALNTGIASGNIPILGSDGKLNSAVIPVMAINNIYPVASQAAMLALSADVGDIAARTDGAGSFMLKALPATTLANWIQITAPTDDVTSVNGKAGVVTLTTDNIGEGANLYFTTARVNANFNTNIALTSVRALKDGGSAVMDGDTIVIDCGTVSGS